MSVSQIGGVFYANQNTPVAAQQQQQTQNRVDFQATVASELAEDKQAAIEQTRPAEQSAGINPDRERQKKEEEEKQERARKKREALPEKKAISEHKLNLRV
ncbi:MAG: hypothetical protein LBU73_05165 [Helicobacteraceae bacterium]|jgi:hypothetical protein|nr:hypothetical protein [Helicobacteraceae bacterium]